MKKLDAREERFVGEYLRHLDPKKAALDAEYSKTTAASKAYQWVSDSKSKPHVFAAIEAGKAARSERTEIDADWVLTRLAQEAEADLADLYDEDMNLKPVHEWPLIWRQGLVAGVDVEELFEGRGEDRERVGTVRKVKLSDRIKRVELIGKHVLVQAFRDQLGIGDPNGGPVRTVTTDMTPQEAAEAYAATLDGEKE